MVTRTIRRFRKMHPRHKLELGSSMILIAILWGTGLEGALILLLLILGIYIVGGALWKLFINWMDETL